MNVHVSEHWQRFIQDEIQRGRFASADQMIDEALRLLKESAGQVADKAQRLLKEHNQAPAGSAPMASAAAGAAATQKPIWEIAADLRTSVPEEEWAKLPVDGAEQHDHYIYGTPKRPATQ